MLIKIKKDDFFGVLEKNPGIKELYENDYERKKAKAIDENKKIKVVIKPKDSLSAQMIVFVDNSEIIEIRVLQKKFISTELIKSMRRVGVHSNK